MDAQITYNTITRDNIGKLSVIFKQLVDRSSFVAIDTEFTGLNLQNLADDFGFDFRKWNTRERDLSTRYLALKKMVRTHAVVSIGVSIFCEANPEAKKERINANEEEKGEEGQVVEHRSKKYNVNNFYFVLHCQDSHLVNPGSLEFLASNGYDFNLQVKKGIRYSSVGRLWEQGQEQEQNGSQGYVVGGAENDGVNSDGNKRKFVSKKREVKRPKHEEFNDGRILRHLLRYVISSGGGKLGKRGRKIVVHNGLLDLMYIYNIVYKGLPESISKFVANLSYFVEDIKVGKNGIIEKEEEAGSGIDEEGKTSVYDTKYISEYKTRDNITYLSYLYEVSSRKGLIDTRIMDEIKLPTVALSVNKKRRLDSRSDVCETYYKHGYCRLGRECSNSHDVKHIVDVMVPALVRKNKEAESGVGNGSSVDDDDDDDGSGSKSDSSHYSAIDAYMTGYLFGSYIDNLGVEELEAGSKNKVYIIGKEFPLSIEKSKFTQPSEEFVKIEQRCYSK